MYDYHMVFVYPSQPMVEDLDGVEESVISELEKLISRTVDDGWEYVSTTTFPKSADNRKVGQNGLKSFVYRRLSRANAGFSDPNPKASTMMKPVKKQSMKNEAELTQVGSNAPIDSKKTVLLTMALLNAVRIHSRIEPETLLPRFFEQGEITEKEQQTLSAMLKNPLTAAQVARISPRGHEEDVFRVSLMPFGAEDSDYAEYIAELGVYLNLEDSFILREVSQKHL